MTLHERPDDIVRVATATNPMEAHVMQQALEAEGISCKVVGDYLEAAFGDIPGMRAEVWVHRNDLAAAQALLAKPLTSSATEDTETANEPEA
jgi:hypothetical protein